MPICKSKWINQISWVIPHIPKQINIPTPKPYRILTNEPPRLGIIMPGPVVI